MKLTINKEIIRKDNVEFFNCENCKSDCVIAMSKFCPDCGEPIEWLTERTVEELLDDVIIEQLKCCFSNDKSLQEKATSLKQELLNKINK